MANQKDTMIDDDLPIDDLGDDEFVTSPEEEESEEEQNTVKSLEDLIAIGKQRGYVTEGEISQLVPNPETDLDKQVEIQEALADWMSSRCSRRSRISRMASMSRGSASTTRCGCICARSGASRC